ncbi:MAG: UDP-4-amino-4,6-dideoxy-N-acetyl-beta-L-altrosamine transaminase [Methanoregula sp.]|uniref:UDP-4-amino-4, 6-dideoxy-N-acetyl-beta-L-altrosamine transaminase n=1 Tax=Methanoregula sp. TaxID=2052170 RepID=UPI0025D7578D|nr:UDP-4-amino-4,6-dideoxy-N-acetyl-beta-L-altrosamine transaminase [Methanoregula sp.]MCK9631771.1 UDP-4-amino-4,6-dideoxy-N-acetyl-beta-L-altrosamine transaminase [Methanoregula sp.]
MKTIPYGSQWIDDTDINAVCSVLKSDWLTQGPMIERFEKEIAEYVGSRYAVAFNSGTSALHGAMFAAGITSGDEVITSPITFVATPNSAAYQGAHPVFVDIDMGTYCIDPQCIKEVITEKTKVIAPVDMAGYPVDLPVIMEIAADHDVVVIEDAAHALGAMREGTRVGSEADMTMFSFHPVKHITTGEGGIITTNREDFAERLQLFRSHGITKDPRRLIKNDGPWYYEMQELGYNYRITDLQCALGLSQMKKLEHFIARRNVIAKMYNDAFRDRPNIIIPPVPKAAQSRHAYHLYPIRVSGIDRKSVFLDLREQGIFCQVHYIPVHLQPYYQEVFGYREGDYPIAEEYYRAEISLPMFPRMTDDDVTQVITTVQKVIQGNS